MRVYLSLACLLSLLLITACSSDASPPEDPPPDLSISTEEPNSATDVAVDNASGGGAATATTVPVNRRPTATDTAAPPPVAPTARPTRRPTNIPPTPNLSRYNVQITEFSADVAQVFGMQLRHATARLPVRWAVSGRPDGSNLAFEQRLTNGRVVNVELPRFNAIIDSSGRGTVAPVFPGEGAQSITLVLRVFDVSSGATYTTREISLPINNDPDEGVTFFDDCFADPFLPSANLRIGEQVYVRFYAYAGRRSVYSTRAGTQDIGALTSEEPLTILEGPVCFRRSADDDPVRRWLIKYENGVEGWTDEYVIFTNDDHWYFLRDSFPGGAEAVAMTLDKTQIAEGESITVTWDVANVEYVSIHVMNARGDFPIHAEGDRLPPSGSAVIDAPLGIFNQVEMIYPPRAINPLRFEVTCTYTVIDPEHRNSSSCPEAEQSRQAAFQPFQQGYMIWLEDGTIIVYDYRGFAMNRFPDTYQEGETLTYPADPPDGLIAPVRGFGKVWVTHRMVQQTLGWATAPETAYTLTWQRSPLGVEEYTYYITLPDGSYANYSTYTTDDISP